MVGIHNQVSWRFTDARRCDLWDRGGMSDDAARGTARDEVRLAFLVAGCLLVEAVVAKEVLDVSLDYFSQFAALWVFIADRKSVV